MNGTPTFYTTSNRDKNVLITSDHPFTDLLSNKTCSESPADLQVYQPVSSEQPTKPKRLAYVCNWGQACGISTYSRFLYDGLQPEFDEINIFSEYPTPEERQLGITYCWKRGESLTDLLEQIKQYNPDYILVQHEWGLFPNALHFMQFILGINQLSIPYVVSLHSVYDHLDKTIPLSVVKNIVVHSEQAKQILKSVGFTGIINVIPHGCPEPSDKPELYNIFGNPYVMFGYGFGFRYKGVELAIDAVDYLVKNDPKFKKLTYIYVCSDSVGNQGVHNTYYNQLVDKVQEKNLTNNILIIRGYLSDSMLENYLRTVKLVVFPYVMDGQNVVYGASGAIKIAMSHGNPVIASRSHLFDDIEGVVPRISNAQELASEIDRIFSSSEYRESLVKKNHEYISNNTWMTSGQKYARVLGV